MRHRWLARHRLRGSHAPRRSNGAGVLRPHRGPAPARWADGRVRGRLHPAPRVAPAGAKDPWAWYGWSIWAGDRYRWFVYATFGHSAAEPGQRRDPGGGRAGQRAQRRAARRVGDERALRVPARRSRAARGEPQPTASARVHDRGPGARSGQGVRGGPRRGPVRSSRARRSGIGWWRAAPLRAMSGCVPSPACRRFSREERTGAA